MLAVILTFIIAYDLVDDKLPTKELLDEKFGDNIIYLIIKKASIIDKIENNESFS